MTITPEQRQAVLRAGDSPVQLDDPETGVSYVLLRADVFLKLRESLEDKEDRRDHEEWGKLARHARISGPRRTPTDDQAR